MLKFKITNEKMGIDVKTLSITQAEKQDFTTYDIPDGEYGVVNELDDEMTYKFWVEDLFTIQEDSHLTSVSNVTVDSTNGDTTMRYKYVEDVVVTSASKADNCITINVKKEIPLDVESLYIETRYNGIKFIENQWEIFKTTKEWVDENNAQVLNTTQAAYGQNNDGVLNNQNNYYIAFYYENSSWKQIKLFGDDLEGCLNNGKIDFTSIHEYDKDENDNPIQREAISLDEDKVYYTRENYIFFDVFQTHFFGSPSIEYEMDDTSEFIERIETNNYGTEVIKSISYPTVYMYIEEVDENTGMPYSSKVEQKVNVETTDRLCFNCDEIDKKLKNLMFPNGYEIDLLTDDIPYQNGEFGSILFKRDNMMYDNRYSTYYLMYDFANNVIQIPMSQKFSNDLFHNDMIQKNFVDYEMSNAINPIIDMEKDVYTPAIQSENNVEQINADYIDCYKIIFNLHFREHRDTNKNGQKEEWHCDRDCYWNGTRTLEKEYTVDGEKEIKKVVDLKGRVYNYKIENEEFSKKEKYDYFSYFGVNPTEPTSKNDKHYDNIKIDYNLDDYRNYIEMRKERSELTEYQSDLLSYLGFTDDDVRYQKSKLKKSFLRISFYDSDNIANQNLLHTSTIFLDSGDLFAKYIKNIETENEYVSNGDIITPNEYDVLTSEEQKNCEINGEPLAVVGGSFSEDSYTVYNNIGVAVNREPMRKKAIDVSKDLGDDIDELERLRLSSQIVVTDKYSSKRSSEGFYFYTYKNNDGGVFPNDIYMRVEFNHSGYGRTIPFMMPYIRKNEEKEGTRYADRENKIKTFDDICYDWSEVDIDKGVDSKYLKEDNDIGYGTVRYMKYCHIKWKYRYDKHTQKHIYYLDPDVYGNGVTSDNNHGNNIILNLYEGKIR